MLIDKFLQLVKKMLPCGILFEQDMVSAFQGNKTGPFDARCNQTALLERHPTVFPAVKNEGWALNLIQQIADIHGFVGGNQARGVFR